MSREALMSPGAGPAARLAVATTAGAATGMTGKEIAGILRQRMWLIILMTFLGSIGSMGIWFVFRQSMAEYTSTGLIECMMPVQENLLTQTQLIPNPQVITMQAQKHADMLNNPGFLGRVLTRPQVRETSWYDRYADDPAKALEEMDDDFSATVRRGSGLIIIQMKTGDPTESKLIVDEALLLFTQEWTRVGKDVLQSQLKRLLDRSTELNKDISIAQGSLRRAAGNFKVPGALTGLTPIMEELKALAVGKMEMAMQQESLNEQIRRSDEDLQAGRISRAVQAFVQNDRMVQFLRDQITTTQVQRDILRGRFGDDHDQVIQIAASLAGYSAQLTLTENELLRRYVSVEQAGLRDQLAEVRRILTDIEERIGLATEQQSGLDQKVQDYLLQEGELTGLKMRLAAVEDEINSKRISLQDGSPLQFEIRSAGVKPLEASWPRWKVFLPGGFLLGMFLGVGLAFLLAFLDDSVRSPADVARYLNAPMLGIAPEYDERDGDRVTIAMMAARQPHALLSESYRRVKANLLLSAPSEELKVILVTGGLSESGTTTAVVNLGATLASEGKRTLLVDANFHRPALKDIFPSGGDGRGLSNVLAGQSPAAEVIRASGVEGLDIIETGPKPPNPGHLFGNGHMQEFLSQLRSTYDYILIDGPAGLVVSDSRIIGSQVDGMVMVVQAGETSRGVCQRMIREFEGAQVRILGILLNAVQAHKGGYFREAFETYYEYVGTDQEESNELAAAGPATDDSADSKKA